jgi:pimeloyl-ACP methyl ester carboxylesterase
MKINILKLKTDDFNVNAMAFLPIQKKLPYMAIFTHGYTSSKTSILSWATRLAVAGIPSIIFDLPGHYLGSYNEVESADVFKEKAPSLFFHAYTELKKQLGEEYKMDKLIIGGHSLGALLSIKAMELPELADLQKINISVGFGLNESTGTHLFDSEFYQQTMIVRNQLVCPALNKEVMLKWIRSSKEELTLSKQRIHLICGQDDIVVGQYGQEYLADLLKHFGNDVTSESPKKLPHHTPEAAAAHINSFIRKELL